MEYGLCKENDIPLHPVLFISPAVPYPTAPPSSFRNVVASQSEAS